MIVIDIDHGELTETNDTGENICTSSLQYWLTAIEKYDSWSTLKLDFSKGIMSPDQSMLFKNTDM